MQMASAYNSEYPQKLNLGMPPNAMLILAFDTTMSRCAVALCSDGSIKSALTHDMVRGHAGALVPMIQEVMAGAARDLYPSW